jgi:hypothetical protein
VSAAEDGPAAARAELLAAPVFSNGETRPFGELTRAAVEARATELGEATGFGHRSRVAGVGSARRGRAPQIRETDAATVADQDPAELAEAAGRRGVVPPGGSLQPRAVAAHGGVGCFRNTH